MLTGRGLYSLWLFTFLRSSVPFGWVVASRWRRSRPPARPRPSGFKPEAATRQLHHPGAEDGGPDPLRSPAHPTSNRGPPPWRFHLPRTSPDASKREVAEGGDPDSQRLAAPIAFQAEPAPGRFILQARKAGDLNARVSPPHPLATEPGAPVRFTFHSYRTADSNSEPPGSGPGAST